MCVYRFESGEIYLIRHLNATKHNRKFITIVIVSIFVSNLCVGGVFCFDYSSKYCDLSRRNSNPIPIAIYGDIIVVSMCTVLYISIPACSAALNIVWSKISFKLCCDKNVALPRKSREYCNWAFIIAFSTSHGWRTNFSTQNPVYRINNHFVFLC